MSLGDLFKGLLGGNYQRVDYGELSDDELLRLSASRGSLTADARRDLDRVLDARGLKKAAPVAEPTPEAIDVEMVVSRDAPAAIEGEPVLVLERRGVVLRTQANASVLVVMPIWDAAAPFAIDRPDVRSNCTELVVLNQRQQGWLPTAYIAERLTVRNEMIYALDPALPADRPLPNFELERTITPATFEEELVLGHLSLERTSYPDVIIATWDEVDLAIVIGPAIPPAFFGEYEGITHVIGGLLPPETEEDRAIYADPELYQTLDTVILLLDHAGVSSWPVTVLPALGVTVQAVGREEGSEADELAVGMKQAIDRGEWEEAEQLLEELSAREIEDVVDGLAIERNLEAAERVLALALASEDWRESGRIRFLHGVTKFMRGDADGAIAAYRTAVEGEEAEPRAFANLSAIYRRRRDHGDAIRFAESAVAAMPEDAISVVNLVAAHASAGRTGEAKAVIDRHEELLGSAGAMEWRARVEAWPPFEDGPDEFPHLADKAYQIGCVYAASDRSDQAEALFRRCLELQPSHLEAVLELGVLMSSLGREEEAIALYDQTLEKAPGISLVRFNRASCLARLSRTPEAVAELERVAREVPEWEAPREAIDALASTGSERKPDG